MRTLLLSLLFTSVGYAQIDPGNGSNGPCNELTLAASGTFNCTTLTINNPLNLAVGLASPLIIKVQGDVLIRAPINLNGEAGTYSGSVAGGRGGPGAGDGGGISGIGPEPSPDAPLNGGDVGSPSGSCGGGGGGGSFFNLGDSGTPCTGGPGGSAGTSTFNPFTIGSFRGGFGGGTGGEGPLVDAGTGGGGGGSLHIMAGGNIVINANISARGGDGGDANNPNAGGGGGGGSGGAIWIQTLSQMTNNGIFTITGGEGGFAFLGGRGGNGGSGAFLLEDSDGVIEGSGSGAVGSGSKLKSDISCGTVSKNRNSHSQMLASFALVLMIGWLLKKSKIFSQT